MACICARVDGEYPGWLCSQTGLTCCFIEPDSGKCADRYNLGLEAEGVNERERDNGSNQE